MWFKQDDKDKRSHWVQVIHSHRKEIEELYNKDLQENVKFKVRKMSVYWCPPRESFEYPFIYYNIDYGAL